MSRPRSAKLMSAKAKARREGWLQEIRSEADERAVLAGHYFDAARADHVVEFGRRFLRHQKGEFAGQPFELLDWQRDELFRPLFGWVHDSEEFGRTVRRFRRSYIEIPKKNGKSAIGSYVGLYMLMADNERGAEIYSAATDKNQAAIVWANAAEMVEASPELAKLCRINRVIRNIAVHSTKSFYRVLSACPRRNEGWNASAIIVDELHKWYGRELFDALKWAFAARAEPLLFQITTAGDDPTSVCHEQYEYAKAVMQGQVVDHQYFPLIYEAAPDDDPTSEDTWLSANPSLGRTADSPLKLSTFRADFEEARQNVELFESWKQLRLDIWRTSTTPWIDIGKWDAGATARKRAQERRDCHEQYSDNDLAGFECWAGLDLALTTDLSAFVLLLPDDLDAATDDVIYRTICRFWLPEETAEKFSKRVPYRQWADAGWITLTDGSEADFDRIREDIAADLATYGIRQMAYDPMFASYLTQRLEIEHGIERVEFGQTFRNYTEPCKMLERLIAQQRLRHNGNAVLRWCLGNTSVKTDDEGRLRPVRPKRKDHRRIDGTVALLMALALALRGAEEQAGGYYAENEVEWV